MSGDSGKGSTSCGSTPYLINECHSVEGVRGVCEKRERNEEAGSQSDNNTDPDLSAQADNHTGYMWKCTLEQTQWTIIQA